MTPRAGRELPPLYEPRLDEADYTTLCDDMGSGVLLFRHDTLHGDPIFIAVADPDRWLAGEETTRAQLVRQMLAENPDQWSHWEYVEAGWYGFAQHPWDALVCIATHVRDAAEGHSQGDDDEDKAGGWEDL